MNPATVALREDQIRRYARHVLLPDVGGRGQARLLAATVVVELAADRAVEAAALAYLAAAGVGTLVLAGDAGGTLDGREIARGILYGAADLGRPRGEAARARIAAINPDVEVALAGAMEPTTDTLALADELDAGGAPGGSGAADHDRAHDSDGDSDDDSEEAGRAVADALARGGAAACRLLIRIARQGPS